MDHIIQLDSTQFPCTAKPIILEVNLEEQEHTNLEGIFLSNLEIMALQLQYETLLKNKDINKFYGYLMEKYDKLEVPTSSLS